MSKRLRKSKKKAPKIVPGATSCPICHGDAHVGDSEEALAALDPEAIVFYDRDVAGADSVLNLCGPRFRVNSAGLYAHYGSPVGDRYVVFFWKHAAKLWECIIDTAYTDAAPLQEEEGRT